MKIAAPIRFLAGYVRRPLRPFQNAFEREREQARASINSESLITVVAALALYAVFEDVVTQIGLFAFYSTLIPEDFVTYHPNTPYLKISGAIAFILAVHLRGERYWLIYAIPLLLIFGNIMLLGLIQGWLDPEDFTWAQRVPQWLKGVQ